MSDYDETKKLLEGLNLAVPLATEDYIWRHGQRIKHDQNLNLSDTEVQYLNSITLLRAADFCITKNLGLDIVDGERPHFRTVVHIDVCDAQISVLTGVCTCLINPYCSMPKDNVAYVAVFAGEGVRLWSLLKRDRATDIYSEFKDPSKFDSMIKDTGEKHFGVPQFLQPWFRMKGRVWFEITRLINDCGRFKNEKLSF
jgi:hypothetical protein